MNKWLLILLFLSCQGFAQIAENRIESPVPASKIFSNQQFRSPMLSPDATYITVFEYNEENARVGLIERKTDNFIPLADLGAGGMLKQYFWLTSERLFLEVSVVSLGQRIDVMTIVEIQSVDSGAPTFTSHPIRHRGNVLGRAHQDPEKLVFAFQPKKGDTEIYVTDPMALTGTEWNGEDEIDDLIDDAAWYFYDTPADKLISLTYDDEAETFSLQYRPLRGESWQLLLNNFDTEYTFKPVGFIDENTLAVLSDISTDKVALYRYHIATQSFSDVLYEHESYDLVDADVSYETGTISSVTYYKGGELTVAYLNSVHHYRQSVLNASMNGRNAVLVDYSADPEVYIVAAYAPNAPADYYVYDVEQKVANLLFSVQPELDHYVFSTARLLTFESASKQVEAYYYPPVGSPNDVLLVMPHGGPVGIRDTAEFNRVVQFYTTRGYAVLQVNYHGSFGFGKAFRKGGVGEFGQQIEKDIVQAIELVQQQNPSQKRCAVGASYGGYSSLMLSILHPDLIDCVVARFGVYDLPLLFNQSNLKTSENWLEKVENTVGEYNEDLYNISPLYLAANLSKPLLLTAGYDDDVAAFEHTQRLDYVLTKLGKPFEHAYYKNTGHGHSRWSGDQHEHVLIDDFIRRQLAIPQLDTSNLTEEEQALLAEELLLVADGFFNGNQVDMDESKADYFYQRAAKGNQSEALYKLALSQLSATESMHDTQATISLLKDASALDSAEASYELAYRYMLDYRFDAPQPDLAKPFLDRALALEEGYRTIMLKTLWDCLWGPNSETECIKVMSDLPIGLEAEYSWMRRKLTAELIARFNGNKQNLEAILKELANISSETVDLEVLKTGLRVTQANGEDTFQSVSQHTIQAGDELVVQFKVSSVEFLRKVDEPLGVVAEWQGIREDGEVETLHRLFLYGQTRKSRYGGINTWQSGRQLSIYDLQFKAIKVVLKDIYNDVKFSETFNINR